MFIFSKKNKKVNLSFIGQIGFGMVEVVIASAIMGAVTVSVISVYHSLANISLQNTPHIQATFLLEEGVEAVKVMRDTSWSNIASSTLATPYYLKWEPVSGTWVATTSLQLVDIFTRSLVFSEVERDGDFNIITNGGTVDPNSRKVTVEVAWPSDEGTTTKSVETYIFKTFNN